jgi:hypothetical protein
MPVVTAKGGAVGCYRVMVRKSVDKHPYFTSKLVIMLS